MMGAGHGFVTQALQSDDLPAPAEAPETSAVIEQNPTARMGKWGDWSVGSRRTFRAGARASFPVSCMLRCGELKFRRAIYPPIQGCSVGRAVPVAEVWGCFQGSMDLRTPAHFDFHTTTRALGPFKIGPLGACLGERKLMAYSLGAEGFCKCA